ncbi:MAG TPA: hypothetical protein VL742_02880 [Casimicrobiaceae bacterium]|nr:hypothetical protein [Casimicrobiaceae bacterium]
MSSDRCDLGHQPRLANAGFARDGDDRAAAVQHCLEPVHHRGELGGATDQGGLVGGGGTGCRSRRSYQRVHGYPVRLAFQGDGRERFPDEGLADRSVHRFRDIDLPGQRFRHQPRGEVYGVAQTGEREPPLVAVGTAAQTPMGDADPDAGGRGGGRQRPQRQRGVSGAGRVVLVGDRRAEHRVEVRPLVAERQLQQVPAVRPDDLLCLPHERVQLADRLFVLVVVDSAEVDEHGVRRPKLRQEFAAAGDEALVDLGQEPALRDVRRQRDVVESDAGWPIAVFGHPRDNRADASAGLVASNLPDLRSIADGFERRAFENHFAPFGDGERVDQSSREDVHELDFRIADDETPRVARRDCHLHRQPHARPARRGDLAEAIHRFLHREPASRRAYAVVAVDPARHRASAAADDVAAPRLELLNQGVEHAIEMMGEHLRAALRPELLREGFGQRGEAGDVGEQRRPADAIRHGDAGGDRSPAAARNVGFEAGGHVRGSSIIASLARFAPA